MDLVSHFEIVVMIVLLLLLRMVLATVNGISQSSDIV